MLLAAPKHNLLTSRKPHFHFPQNKNDVNEIIRKHFLASSGVLKLAFRFNLRVVSTVINNTLSQSDSASRLLIVSFSTMILCILIIVL